MKFHEKKVLQTLIVLSSITMVVLSLVGDTGYFELQNLKNTEQTLIKEIEELKTKRLEWHSKIKSAKKNPAYIETLAREEFGLIKPGEKLVKLVVEKKEEKSEE